MAVAPGGEVGVAVGVADGDTIPVGVALGLLVGVGVAVAPPVGVGVGVTPRIKAREVQAFGVAAAAGLLVGLIGEIDSCRS